MLRYIECTLRSLLIKLFFLNVVLPQVEPMVTPQDSWDSLFTCRTQQIKKMENSVLRTLAIPEPQYPILQT